MIAEARNMQAARFLAWGDVGLDCYEDEAWPRPGGCALNVALAYVEAGGAGPVAVAAPIGPDGAGLRGLLAARGVDVAHVEVRPGAATPRQRIALRAGGERDLCGYTPGALAGHRPGEALRAAVRGAGLVYVPVFSTTLGLAEDAWALRPGAPLAADLMDLSDVDDALAREAVRRSTWVFLGLDVARHGAWLERLRAWASEPGAATVVVTLGARGARAFAGPLVHAVAAAPVPGGVVLDTTGCGDAFAGALLASVSRGETLDGALEAAARAAARVAGRRGAVEAPEGWRPDAG